jgi:Zn-dependent protease
MSASEAATQGAAKRRNQGMDGNLSVGRFGGVELRLNWSLLAVVALIVWSLAEGVFPEMNPGLSHPTYIGMATVAALLFLASIALHELGHSWECRSSRVGSRVPAPSSVLPSPGHSSRSSWAFSSC